MTTFIAKPKHEFVKLTIILLCIFITTRCYAPYSYSLNGQTEDDETFRTLYNSKMTENGIQATINISIISSNKAKTLLGGLSKSLISNLEGLLNPENLLPNTVINIELLYPLGNDRYQRRELLLGVEGVPMVQVWFDPYFTNNGDINKGVLHKANSFRCISGSEIHVKDILTGDYKSMSLVRDDYISHITPVIYGVSGEMNLFSSK